MLLVMEAVELSLHLVSEIHESLDSLLRITTKSGVAIIIIIILKDDGQYHGMGWRQLSRGYLRVWPRNELLLGLNSGARLGPTRSVGRRPRRRCNGSRRVRHYDK